MKTDRLIGIIMTLLQQEQATAPELARQFEVSRRTISRDIEDLCKAGIPLITTQGRGGGISIAENYKLEKTFFTPEELQALLAGLRGLDSVSAAPYAPRVAQKLSRRDRPLCADGTILIDLASHYSGPLREKIAAIRQAIRTKHVLAFRYCGPNGETARRAEPCRLAFQWDAWYLLGFCLDKKDFRMFKLNRLWELHILEETFSSRPVPAQRLQFDAYFKPVFHLKALFSPEAKDRLIDAYGPDCYEPCPDGRLLLERDFTSYAHMREWAFSFGAQAELLEPSDLVRDRLTQAEKILHQGSKT